MIIPQELQYALTVTAPASEPVSAAEARSWLRLTDSADPLESDSTYSTRLELYIATARDYVERFLGRQLIQTTLVMRLDCFPDWMLLPRPPLVSVQSVTYYDSDNVSQTLATSQYDVSIYGVAGRIIPKFGVVWPITYIRPDAVTVNYTGGYGTTGSSVPAPIRTAILWLVAHYDQNPEAVLVGSISKELEYTLSATLAPFVVARF